MEANNMAVLREALSQCELFLGNVSKHGHPTLNPGDKCTACAGVDELRGMVVRALSMPVRNCDVGTAEEQAERFTRFCLEYHSHETLCSQCPMVKNGFPLELVDKCQLAWAQMPYEKKVENQ